MQVCRHLLNCTSICCISYTLTAFYVSRKALGRNVPLEQATALAAGAWNGLSKEKRAPYEHISSVEKINYDHAMAVYQKKLADIVPQVGSPWFALHMSLCRSKLPEHAAPALRYQDLQARH